MGTALWGIFTSVNFAVLQIILLSLAAVVGMTIRQLPDFAFRNAAAYADEIDKIHVRYDPVFGADIVGFLEWLQVFQVFRASWFSLGLLVLIVSIVICTLDRTPRLWRQSADIRVIQPDPFFDPRLPDRARMTGTPPDAVRDVLRRHRFRVREAEANGIRYLYGDRHRWTKMATLLTHLGLILFLVAAAVTSRFGFEAPLVVAEGDAQTIQNVGTPGLLLVRNLGFEAPGVETGQPSDFTSELVVYRDGVEIAHKTIRVNDPLSVAGYTLHQNGFGPAPDVVLRDANGDVLWSGPVPLTGSNAGEPYDEMAVPGRDMGLALQLRRLDDGRGVLLVAPYRIRGENADGTPDYEFLGETFLQRGDVKTSTGLDLSIELRGFSEYTLLIAKSDPGQGLVWFAFASLITGLVISFYLPRRRVWTRLTTDGELSIVGRSDRYVDFDREFGRLLQDLVAVRRRG
jgi:cytochrome c biogenesis protein